MRYRTFSKSIDFQVSALGFGAMRFPLKSDKSIDEPESIKMIRTAVDGGVNYIDTAWPYHDGNSELLVAKALKDGYRQKVKIATKLPTWLVQSAEDFNKHLDQQLVKLETETIDFYMIHAVGRNLWENKILKFNLLNEAEKAIAAGKIQHIGFSFHDDYDAFIEIVDGYNKWEFCQVQYNYLDVNNQAGTAGVKYAADKGLGVIVMEPLLGGKLAIPSKKIIEIFNSVVPEKTAVEWALDFVWNMPEVSLLLSGMSSIAQVTDNLIYAGRSSVGMLSEKEKEAIKEVQLKFEEIKAVPCTKCNYCMPCPNNIDIPQNFEIYNNSFMYDDFNGSRDRYSNLAKRSENKKIAGSCIQCGICEDKCPQKIKIGSYMPKVHELFSI